MRSVTTRMVLVALAVLAALLGAATVPAVAGTGTDPGETIQGVIRNQGEPVEGVRISVSGPGGFSGTATTDAAGAWAVPVPGPGSYRVELDPATLPAGVTLRFPDRNPLTTSVGGGQQRSVLFATGANTREVASRADQVLDRAAQGLRFGLLLALAAVGLSLIFGTTGLTNFAHGEMVTFGALVAFGLHGVLGLPLLLATAITVVLAGAAGLLTDTAVWGPLRRRGTGLIAMMIVSIGLSILLRYFFLYLFGGDTRTYPDAQGQRAIGPGPITLTALDYLSMGISVAVMLGTAWFLLGTRTGKATRAVADNPALASASGIDVDRVIKVVWILGGALAGLAGVLLGIAQQVNFQMGFQILLLIFAAVTLGGLGTAFGALVGSIVVGLFVEVSSVWVPTELKYVGALGILIVILLFRPQGILGRAQRIG